VLPKNITICNVFLSNKMQTSFKNVNSKLLTGHKTCFKSSNKAFSIIRLQKPWDIAQ